MTKRPFETFIEVVDGSRNRILINPRYIILVQPSGKGSTIIVEGGTTLYLSTAFSDLEIKLKAGQ